MRPGVTGITKSDLKMSNQTQAVLLVNSQPIASLSTSAKNGATVSYGYTQLDNGLIHEVGRAKISRNKKYLNDNNLMYHLSMEKPVYINNANDGSC